jgi:hypothetical protein
MHHLTNLQLPGFATKFGASLAGFEGWNHLYSFSWFFVCVLSSVIYFGVSFVGDYAKEERTMPFEALALAQDDILNGIPRNLSSQEGSKIDVTMDTKV